MIDNTFYPYPFTGYTCASCKMFVPYGTFHSCTGFFNASIKTWKFCPHCGEELE